MAHRRGEIEPVLANAHKQGKDALFLTITIRHHINSRLSELIDAQLAGWRSVFSGDKSGERSCLARVDGQIKSLEIRYGKTAGWHPHLHVLLLVNHKGLSELEAALLDEQISEVCFSRYAKTIEKRGYESAREAFNSQSVKDLAGKITQYIQKFEASLELTGNETKEGKSYTAFQLLALYARGEREVFGHSIEELFREYQLATKKRRQISFSRGLAAEFMDEKDIEDEEQEQEPFEKVVIATIQIPLWKYMCKHEKRAEGLDIAEHALVVGDLSLLHRYLEALDVSRLEEQIIPTYAERIRL